MGGSPSAGRLRGVLARTRGEIRQRRRRAYVWRKRAELDLKDRWRGTSDPLIPPRRYGFASQYKVLGVQFLERMLIGLADLQPDERVLDVGCGPGRMAAPLTQHLNEGSYEGFDVTPRAIRWASGNITSRHPSFRFQLADIHNAMYNPEGTQTGASFHFPYPDDSFDVSFAISLYTHLRPLETRNYLAETERVMRPGGRTLNTFFLLNDESLRLLERRTPVRGGDGPIDLSWEGVDEDGWRYRSPKPEAPEHLLALHENDIRRMYDEVGLEIEEIRYGHWCGRPASSDEIGQDLVFARKPEVA